MILHLICDTSGSMGESGKPLTMRTAVLSAAQWVRFGYAHAEIRLYGWSSEVRCFSDWNIPDEFPAELLACQGISNWDALIQLLNDHSQGKVLLFTDGFWSRDDVRALKRWKERYSSDTLRIIKTGADANPQLKGIDVFTVEDLFVALDGWLGGDLA